MKSIYNFINESIERGNNTPLIDLKYFDTIVKNLRRDNPKYIGIIGELTDNVKFSSVENDQVWDHLDAPVNKEFNRGYKQKIELNKGDQLILVYNEEDKDEHPGADDGIINLYICKYEDIWYYLNREDADEFMECVKVLKEDRP